MCQTDPRHSKPVGGKGQAVFVACGCAKACERLAHKHSYTLNSILGMSPRLKQRVVVKLHFLSAVPCCTPLLHFKLPDYALPAHPVRVQLRKTLTLFNGFLSAIAP